MSPPSPPNGSWGPNSSSQAWLQTLSHLSGLEKITLSARQLFKEKLDLKIGLFYVNEFCLHICVCTVYTSLCPQSQE